MRSVVLPAALLAAVSLLAACGSRSQLLAAASEPAAGGMGGAVAASSSSSSSSGTGGACTPITLGPASLAVRIRDFHDTHPDFEKTIGDDPGIVEPHLGPDGKPVYDVDGSHPTTSGEADFDQWYNDVPGVNEGLDTTITLDSIPGGFVFASDEFFPIDDQLFGDEGRPHNFHFTLEGHTTFRYAGGEVFSFAGDDDFWAFVNGTLIVDLGGVHQTEEAQVTLAPLAAELGLVPGEEAKLDVFFAERHTDGSTFHLLLSGFALCE